MTSGACATPEQLASGHVDAAHVATCLACRRELYEQRAIRTSVAWVRVPPIALERRRTLAAEVMARADLCADTRRSRVRPVALVAAAALAAAALLAILARDEAPVSRPQPSVAQPAAAPSASPPVPPPVPPSAPTSLPTSDLRATSPAPVERAPVRSSPLAPTPREALSRGAAAPKLDRARQVFGATADTPRHAIERDMLVERTPLQEFRVGWEALRAHRYNEAIAAFDRATDPAVAEDAAFWAAIAAQRAGYDDIARKRLDAFLAAFPDSPRAESARRARESVR